MIAAGYGICFLISALAAIYTAQKGYENVDSQYWTALIMIPVVNMAYWLSAQSISVDALITLFYFISLGTNVMLIAVLFGLMRDIGLKVYSWLKVILYSAAFAQLFVIWLLIQDNMAGGLIRVYDEGNGHVAAVSWDALWFAQYSFVLLIAIIAVCVFALFRSGRGTYSRRTIAGFAVMASIGGALYALERVMNLETSTLPFVLAAASALLAVSYDRIHSHDIACLVAEQRKGDSERGFVAVSLDGKFLSCNEKAYDYLPELRSQRVDNSLPRNGESARVLYSLIDNFKNAGNTTYKFRSGKMTCEAALSNFTLRRDGVARGYLIMLRDATQEQRNLDILSDYNAMLNHEVAEKTEHIQMIQRKIVLGMANMIENRDGNTGGHVKRTSDVIQILVDEIMSNGHVKIDKVLARDIVRAAPMHDLGKISIDESILNKPSQLTEEEYEVMKTHSATSGEMVMILLDGVEEEHFVKTAFNVARYHHERWDGRGYPDGLVGEMIPLEARIMAVADVYDTLVSERVYKKPLSFEEASEIMDAGMGTHFDPNMRSVFFACREKLESYYSTAE